MKNGLYRLQIDTPLGTGAGVVVLDDGKRLGGDSSVAYIGNYQQDGTAFIASVDASPHTNIAGILNVFGAPNAKATSLSLSGIVFGDEVRMTGTSRHRPGITLQARFRLLAT